jgi:hypothetical protein
MNHSRIPAGVNAWNWGAFLITPFWALSNQVWIGLICWIPHLIFNINLAILMSSQYKSLGYNLLFATGMLGLAKFLFFVVHFSMAVFLGRYGNIYSWRKNNWISVQIFQVYQKNWTIVGICVGIPYSLLNLYLWERLTDFAYYIINQ